VVDFTPATSAVHLRMQSERIMEIGPKLPKLL